MKKAEVPGETTVFMDSPHDSQDLECHEEFYDAIMAEDQDEEDETEYLDEEDETEDQELVTKEPNMVCYLHVLLVTLCSKASSWHTFAWVSCSLVSFPYSFHLPHFICAVSVAIVML